MNPQDFKIHCSQIGKIMSPSKKEGELSVTCKTFLHEWYSNDKEDVSTKYTNKGEMVEDDLIDFCAEQLGLGILEKNRIERSDEFFIGTCDVDTMDLIIDVKASWSCKTLHQQIIDGLDKNYEWQGRGYMHLFNKPKFILFHGLMDTPAEVNYGNEVTYSDMPAKERWVAYNVQHDPKLILSIQQQVKLCRIYLVKYNNLIRSMLGNVI